MEHPIQFPFAAYSKLVSYLIEDVWIFVQENPALHLTRYGDVLEECGLEWSSQSMSGAVVEDLDIQAEYHPKACSKSSMIGGNLIVLLLLIGLPSGFPACQVTVDRRRQAKTAGHSNNLPRCVGRLFAGEIYDRRSDLLRQTHPPKGNLPQKKTAEFL